MSSFPISSSRLFGPYILKNRSVLDAQSGFLDKRNGVAFATPFLENYEGFGFFR